MINDYAKKLTVTDVAFDCANMAWGANSRLIVANNQHGTDPQAVFSNVTISNYKSEYPHALVENETSLTAQAGLNVVTDPGFVVVYNNGVYTVESAVARIGNVYYTTFANAKAAAQEGNTITVIKPIVISENTTYDLTGIKVEGENVYPIFRIVNGATMTFSNGNVTNNDYVFVLGASDGSSAGNLIINGGSYAGTVSVASVTKGTLTINGGEFKANASEYGAQYLINCIDANYPASANVEIKGGTFYGFDPENNASEGAGTNFCPEGYISDANNDGSYTVRPGYYVAMTGNVKYETLAEAVEAAQADATVTVLRDATGAGVVIDKNVTIDFNGKAYSFNAGVGSTGTQTNGFQILKGNEVTLKNGTLNVAEEAQDKFYILVQNYSDLTVADMTLDGTFLDKYSRTDGDSYVLSNNSGNVSIEGNTTIKANNEGALAFAFDVCDKTSWGYAAPVVTVATEGTIYGNIEVSAGLENNLTITDGSFTYDVTDYCADGYICSYANGLYNVTASPVAKIGDTTYPTLAAAVAAAQDGATITILRNTIGAGVVIDKSVTIDFAKNLYSFKSGVGSTNTQTNGFQILSGNTVTLKNGALEVAPKFRKNFYILVQNYANLTVEDMKLDGTNLDKYSATDGDSYALSNNCGEVYIIGNTNIIANDEGDKAFAFDVCKYQSYAAPVVNVNTTGIIDGDIEVTAEINSNLNISGGYFTVEIQEAWCAESFIPAIAELNGTTYYTVKKGTYVARNITTGQGYETLKEAVNAAGAGHTIELLKDITLEGGYADATEGLRIELPGRDDNGLTIDGKGHTINCGNFEKGIRVYNENDMLDVKVNFNNLTIVNNVKNGRCIDTRNGGINLRINGCNLIATNGNSQPLTIGGYEEIHRVMLSNTTIDAGDSGYGVISFVSTGVDITATSNTKVNGYAAFYVKGDNMNVNLNLGQGVYTGENIHSGESNTFGTVVLEGNNTRVKLYGTNPTVKTIAKGTASQAAFLVLGTNNKIMFESKNNSIKVEKEGVNAYWAMIDADVVSSTEITNEDQIVLPAAQARGFQFLSLEEAVRYANAEDKNVTVVNNNTVSSGIVVGKDLTIDLNGKAITAAEGVYPVIRVQNDANVTITGEGSITNATDYVFVLGSSDEASTGNLTIENGTFTGMTTVASVTKGKLAINGGEFKVNEGTYGSTYLINCFDANYNNGSATVEIKGGTFHKFNPEDNAAEQGGHTNFCPEGYIAVYNAENETYTVKQGVWVAQIGDVKYETLSDAVKAAVSGDVIVLLKNLSNISDITVGYNKAQVITIDLNGYTLSAPDATITSFRTGTVLTIQNGTVIGNTTRGTLRATYNGTLVLGDNLTVSSGAHARAIEVDNGKLIVNENMNVNVAGGIGCLNTSGTTQNYITIASGFYNGLITINNESTCILTGGTYTQDVTEWCAEGYTCINNGDGTYSVVPGQVQTLDEEWNWYSSYMKIENGAKGLVDLETAIGKNGIMIKNDDYYVEYSSTYDMWFGNLETISVEGMYMIKTSAATQIQLLGEFADPTTAITLNKNAWSWIGYPIAHSMDLNAALSNLKATHGDQIKSNNNGYASYYEGSGWYGTLNTLVPGQGYMYYSKNAKDVALVYSTSSSRGELKDNVTAKDNYWTPRSSAFANNMTITAVLNVDGVEMGDNYEVAAFANGEVRGSARPIYVDAIDRYVLFLTVHGEGDEELTFKYIDLDTNEEHSLSNVVTYSNDAILGSLSEPMVLVCGTMGIGENAANTLSIYPNPTTTNTAISFETAYDMVEVFNSLGVKVAEYRNVDSIDGIEAAGVYVIRVTNDSTVQNCRLIVK